MRDLGALESFCLVGGIQVIIVNCSDFGFNTADKQPYTSKRHSPETRLEAALFIQQLTQSPLTMQMFISCVPHSFRGITDDQMSRFAHIGGTAGRRLFGESDPYPLIP